MIQLSKPKLQGPFTIHLPPSFPNNVDSFAFFKADLRTTLFKIEKQNFKNYIIHKGMCIENNLLAFWLQS